MVAISGAAVMTILATPTYTSRTSLFLTIESAASTGELNSGTSYTESQVKNFAKVATAPVVLRRVLDTRVRSAEDVAAVTDVPLVGTVAFDQDAASRPLVVLSDPTSSRSEDFRRLRTNLQFLAIGDRGIAFSSSLEAEGKSSTVINCALALGSANKRVLLIDADLRRPRVAKRMNIGDQPEPNNTPEVPQTAPAQVDDQPAPTQLVSESSHRTPARAAQ